MNKKIKSMIAKMLALGMASVMSLGALAACGDDDSDPNKISFWYWGSPAEVNVYKQLIKQYEKEHPGITIGDTHYESNTYMNKFMAEKKKPDVFFMPDTDFLTWADAGIMEPLDSYVTQAELDNVWSKAINEYRYDYGTKTLGTGKLYGFPKDLGPVCLTYNETLLDQQITKNGLNKDEVYELLDPKDPMTWNEFRTLLKDLTKDQNKSDPNQIYGVPYYELEAALYSNNANYFTDDFINGVDNATYAKLDDRFAEALAFNIQLATVDKVMPDSSRSGSTDAYTMFFNNHTIFTWMGPWDNADFWGYKDLKYNIIPVPYNDENGEAKSVTFAGSMCYGVSAKSKKKDKAVEFAKWISMSESCQKTAVKLGQQVPNLKSMVNDFVSLDAQPKNKSLFIDVIDDTNIAGIYEEGETDMITSKTRGLYYTYFSTWKDNLMTYVDTQKLWEESDENVIKTKIKAYQKDLQAALKDDKKELKKG